MPPWRVAAAALALAALVALCASGARADDSEPCSARTSCHECTVRASCGWCAASERCFDGSSHAPDLPAGCLWGWLYAPWECLDPCAARAACDSCASQSNCGWCDGTRACLSGSEYGPTTGSCVSWRWTSSTCVPACPDLWTCSECTATACGWCASSKSCMFGNPTSPTVGTCDEWQWFTDECPSDPLQPALVALISLGTIAVLSLLVLVVIVRRRKCVRCMRRVVAAQREHQHRRMSESDLDEELRVARASFDKRRDEASGAAGVTVATGAPAPTPQSLGSASSSTSIGTDMRPDAAQLHVSVGPHVAMYAPIASARSESGGDLSALASSPAEPAEPDALPPPPLPSAASAHDVATATMAPAPR